MIQLEVIKLWTIYQTIGVSVLKLYLKFVEFVYFATSICKYM